MKAVMVNTREKAVLGNTVRPGRATLELAQAPASVFSRHRNNETDGYNYIQQRPICVNDLKTDEYSTVSVTMVTFCFLPATDHAPYYALLPSVSVYPSYPHQIAPAALFCPSLLVNTAIS